MTGGDFTGTRFPDRAGGYDIPQVDFWLERIADLREKGFFPAQYMPPQGFICWRRRRGHDPEVVDRFLAGLASEAAAAGLQMLPPPPVGTIDIGDALRRKGGVEWRRFESERRADWQRVSDLPGARLSLTSSKLGTLRQITGSFGEVLLARRHRTITLASGRVLGLDRSQLLVSPSDLQLTDAATGEPALWIRGGHLGSEADGRAMLPGQRHLTFPVSGTRPSNAVMTAVSESGTTMVWFRKMPKGIIEVVVSPDCDLAPEVLCAIELAAGWLGSYFQSRGGGGG